MGKEFDDLLAEKQGFYTPKKILKQALDTLEEIETVVVIMKRKDGELHAARSNMSNLEFIGQLEVAKAMVLEDMVE